MIFALSLPEASLFTAAFSLLTAAFVAFLTQRWIERREQRNRLHALKLQLYLDAVDLIMDNELALAMRGIEGEIPPIELQAKRTRIHHRLKLLGSKAVLAAYDKYDMLVFQSTAHPLQHRPQNPEEVVYTCDRFVDMMAEDLQGGCWRSWIRVK